MNGYKHYIRTDVNGIVTDGYADWETDKRGLGEVQLAGDHIRQFQINLRTIRGQFKYKVVNGQMVERSQAELDAEWNARPPAPKTAEQKEMDKLKTDNEQMNLQIIDLFEQLVEKGLL